VKAQVRGIEVDEVRRLRALAEENARIKRLVADKELQIQILKEVNAKKW
jgi:putative transposase